MKNYVDLPVPVLYVDAQNRPVLCAPAHKPLEWAKKHCPSYITQDAVQKNGNYYYRFFFSDEKDLALFILRWT